MEFHACTIIARNYLPAARVLARSFRQHNPGGNFTTLVVVASRGVPSQRIANLLAPIVVNVDTRCGAQIVLDPEMYSAATPFELETPTIPAPAPQHLLSQVSHAESVSP